MGYISLGLPDSSYDAIPVHFLQIRKEDSRQISFCECIIGNNIVLMDIEYLEDLSNLDRPKIYVHCIVRIKKIGGTVT